MSEQERSRLTVNLIIADKDINNMLRNFDLFEPWKKLTIPLAIEFTVTKPIAEINLEDLLQRVKKTFENDNKPVVALWIASDPTKHWVDWSVIAISNGQKWGLLADYLSQFGITKPVEESENKGEVAESGLSR